MGTNTHTQNYILKWFALSGNHRYSTHMQTNNFVVSSLSKWQHEFVSVLFVFNMDELAYVWLSCKDIHFCWGMIVDFCSTHLFKMFERVLYILRSIKSPFFGLESRIMLLCRSILFIYEYIPHGCNVWTWWCVVWFK